MLMVITFCEFTPPWIGGAHVRRRSRSLLPPRQRAEMIAHVTGGKTLPKEIADEIIDRAGGRPLLIEELTNSVVESGLLVDAGDRFTTGGPVGAAANPDDWLSVSAGSKQTCAERGDASIWRVGATEIAKAFSVAVQNKFAALLQNEHTRWALARFITRSVLLTWRH